MPHFIQVNGMFGFDSVNRLPRTSHDQYGPFCRMKCSISERSMLAIILELSPLQKQFFPPQHLLLCCLYDNFISLTFTSNNKSIFFLLHLFYSKKKKKDLQGDEKKISINLMLFIFYSSVRYCPLVFF